mmetsp:Transcript_23216/g.35850  ORF Transcript_23216/g.35850 Transcript_23216/m.35850 type:complete len:283 (+) Transcript_23216:205-1053(+)|eukprot:CAMPEP_0196802590 /NCGR_PEP_ID=MMETSP1362-20130617/2176_1 /TAXON_ID=163516 /ORGANISM="Leptocylindrus danicus, Strain CCMP1856" /LENGTH=282 /DNA_ID=CAMNT_0042173925 /DNA_START=144 /DNA_END=992 /DNA_ORIENTATION=-
MATGEVADDDQFWSDEDIEKALLQFFVVLFVVVASTVFLTRLLPSAPNAERDSVEARQQRSYDTEHRTRAANGNHLSMDVMSGRGAATIGAEGIAAFQSTDDMEHETIGEEIANSFALYGLGSRLVKGSMVVVTVREEELDDSDTAKVLRSLGCYFLLFVIVSLPPVSAQNKGFAINEVSNAVNRLRKAGLPEHAIPTHRIVACKSVVGRVATVRQLGSARIVGLLLDFDPEARKQLSRFGFNVVIYGGIGASSLGNLLSYDVAATLSKNANNIDVEQEFAD